MANSGDERDAAVRANGSQGPGTAGTESGTTRNQPLAHDLTAG